MVRKVGFLGSEIHERIADEWKPGFKSLGDGNQRFVSGRRTYPHPNSQRLQQLAQGQYPYATILSCSDSRVPPEHIFDVGLGDLFIVRVAGNVCGEIEIGSLEYAVEHLQTPLLVVLGHTACGAVSAAVQQSGTRDNLAGILDKIFIWKPIGSGSIPGVWTPPQDGKIRKEALPPLRGSS